MREASVKAQFDVKIAMLFAIPKGDTAKCHSEQGSDSDASEESRRRTAYKNSNNTTLKIR